MPCLISSIAVTLLVIAFLKVHIQLEGVEPVLKPAWHNQCCCRDTSDLGELLMDFFVFYGKHFPYMECFVTVKPVPNYGLFPPLKSDDPSIVVPKVCMLAIKLDT